MSEIKKLALIDCDLFRRYAKFENNDPNFEKSLLPWPLDTTSGDITSLITLELFSQFTEERNLNLAKFPLCTFYACLLLMYYNTWCVCVVYFPGLGCSKLSLDNTGLVWNLISGLKALKKMQFKSFFMQFDQIVCLSKRLLNKGIKKPGLKSTPASALIGLRTMTTNWVCCYLPFSFIYFIFYLFFWGGGGGGRRAWKERNRGCDIFHPSKKQRKSPLIKSQKDIASVSRN